MNIFKSFCKDTQNWADGILTREFFQGIIKKVEKTDTFLIL